jgi:hypothetical protein
VAGPGGQGVALGLYAYGWRCWIEQTCKLVKRGGWQWQQTRMTDATQVARL